MRLVNIIFRNIFQKASILKIMTTNIKIAKWNNFHAILFSLLFILYSVLSTRIPVIIGGSSSFLIYWIMPGSFLFIIGISIFCLDGLDGFIARKYKQTSEFGAYFDMETDAFYVFLYTIILFEKGITTSYH